MLPKSVQGSAHPSLAVLFSAGLDSAVLLAHAIRSTPGDATVQPIYITAGLAWESEELAAADRLLRSAAFASRARPLVTLSADMRDVYPAAHRAMPPVLPITRIT